MGMKTVVLWTAVAGITILAGCGDGQRSLTAAPAETSAVSDAEARAALADAVAAADAGDLAELCELSASERMCALTLDDLGRESVPVGSAPVVIGSFDLPARTVPGSRGVVGGRVLEVCGHDAGGDPYLTELLVIHERSSTVLQNAVFWSGYRLAATDGASSESAGGGVSAGGEASMQNPERSTTFGLPSDCPGTTSPSAVRRPPAR